MKNSALYKMVSVFVTTDVNNPWHPVPVTNITLFDWLRLSKYDTQVQAMRFSRHRKPEQAKQFKKSLPAVTPSGVFSYRSKDGLKEHSGLICIDIDGKDNMDRTVDELKEICSIAPWVAYAGLSVSGDGVFAIVPIVHPDRHLEHFRAIQKDFADYGVTIDNSCSDISRLRIYSYDPMPYYNHAAEPYSRLIERERREVVLPRRQSEEGTGEAVARMVDEICGRCIDITGGNKDWFNLAASLASEFGEGGRDYFHAVSQFYQTDRHAYNEGEADAMYNRGMRYAHRYTIGTFFDRCRMFGVMAKQTV